MKHYIPKNASSELAEPAALKALKVHEVDVFVKETGALPSTDMIVEFYDALNDLIEGHSYKVNIRRVAVESAGTPLYWAGRTAIFWGDIHKNWKLSSRERNWTSQVFSLAPRTILVGGAVLLLAQMGRADKTDAAVHSNFVAAAQENGLQQCGTDTHLASTGRMHSASTRLSSLRLMSDFVSLDHGAYIAESLRDYIGLTESGPQYQSQLAIRLIQRSGADPLVRQAVDTMLTHIEEPLKIPDISTVLGTSTRQLQRRFLSKSGTKLLCTYRALRLERANSLLRNTDMSLREISAATGFSSITSLGRSFRTMYNNTPEKVREQRFSGCLPGPVKQHSSGATALAQFPSSVAY